MAADATVALALGTSRRGRSTASWRARRPRPQSAPATHDKQPATPHDRRVARLQARYGRHLTPPASSSRWSETLLKRWFREGGVLTRAAVDEVEDDDLARSLMDLIGDGLPTVELEPLALGGLGLLAAAAAPQQHAQVFERLAECLATDGFVVADLLGCTRAPHGVWRAVRDE
jgi:hypothetical protein